MKDDWNVSGAQFFFVNNRAHKKVWDFNAMTFMISVENENAFIGAWGNHLFICIRGVGLDVFYIFSFKQHAIEDTCVALTE